MLPASKEDFPKCLYLDQNKWIDLARAHYGKQGGEAFQDALLAVRKAVEAGKLIVPFSVVNAVEAMLPRDEGRRKRLARFMVDLSGNRTMLPDDSVCRWEIRNAVSRLFGKRSLIHVRPQLVQAGFAHALGMPIQFVGPAGEAIARHMRSSDMTVDFLAKMSGKRERIDQARAGEAGAVAVFEADRTWLATLPLEQRRKLEFDSLFFGTGLYRQDLTVALDGLGITAQAFRSRVGQDQEVVHFLADIPNLDILLTLRMARDQDQVRAIAHNDIRDLDWLSVAVPYSNVVASENYWGHQVQAMRLDEKYGTVVLTDLRQLPEQLRLLGCVG